MPWRLENAMAGLNIKYSVVLALLLMGCPGEISNPTPPVDPAEEEPATGEELYKDKACRNCHSEYSSTSCPTLAGFSQKALIAGKIPNNRTNLRKWLKNPSSIKYGTMMPNLGLTDQEIDTLVEYIYTL